MARVLRENLEKIAQMEMLNVGKPISDARDEAGLGARVLGHGVFLPGHRDHPPLGTVHLVHERLAHRELAP